MAKHDDNFKNLYRMAIYFHLDIGTPINALSGAHKCLIWEFFLQWELFLVRMIMLDFNVFNKGYNFTSYRCFTESVITVVLSWHLAIWRNVLMYLRYVVRGIRPSSDSIWHLREVTKGYQFSQGMWSEDPSMSRVLFDT